MKQLLVTLLLFHSIVCSGQTNDIMTILNLKEEKMPIYKPEVTSGKLLYLKMEYGSSHINNPSDITQLKGGTIAAIDIVYSDHPIDARFQALTKSRIENLKKLNHGMMDKKIKWRLIRQNACSDIEDAKKLFHGIVISYRPKQSEEETAKEITYLKKLFPVPQKIKVESITYTDALELSEEYKTDSVFKRGKILSRRTYVNGKEVFADSSVLLAFERNNWRSMAIVADLTGSMSSYTAQLLIWLNTISNVQRVKQVLFFNDGDRTPDGQKIIGKTGGFYHTRSVKFEDLKNLAFTTMKNGSGGDIPENNVEALIKTIELNPDVENIVMIADNWASVKDISLASQIRKPIRIILCGTDKGINPEYLNLARMTGGSVHTMKEDVVDLMNLEEGQKFIVQGQNFEVRKNMIVRSY